MANADGFRCLLARQFAAALRHPEFQLEYSKPYTNADGVRGWQWAGRLQGRDFHISESRTDEPSSPGRIAQIISDPDNLDRKGSLFYSGGICVEAWYCGRWFQVATPNLPSQPADDFFARFARDYLNE
jgi:hypothetical protein